MTSPSETKAVTKGPQAAVGSGGGKGRRVSRESKGLAPLTTQQSMAKAQVQQAQNACRFIKEQIDLGNMPTAEVLQACCTLSGALSSMIGA
jgi:hypothetical protein